MLDDLPHVDGGLADAATRDADGVDEPETLVEQHYPGLFDVEVLHLGPHDGVDVGGRGHGLAGHHFFLAPAAKFAGSEDGDGLGLADAAICRQFLQTALPEGSQAVPVPWNGIFTYI